MTKTQFQNAWLAEFPWLEAVPNDRYSAKCKICVKTFKIDGSGRSQVASHQKCHSVQDGGTNTKKKPADPKQTTFKISNAGVVSTAATTTPLTERELVCKAEIYRALQVAHYNYSFNSTATDNQLFKLMFPNDPIAKLYTQADSKVKYNLQFGIAPYCKEALLFDIKRTPFTFKFDETTNQNVDKQYDGYLQYWSRAEGKIVNRYVGSLFLGHCTSDDLVEHFNHFMDENQLDPNFLLHLGMDGPATNLAFQRKLSAHLEKNNSTSFLDLDTCSLHPVHTAFRNGITSMSCDIDSLFIDLHFFFKLSSARRKDYSSLHTLTGTMDKYAMKHAETRWLSMKFVAVRVVEQWDNLREYFLEFLPKHPSSKTAFRKIKETKRYQRIRDHLKDPITLAYIAFCAYSARDFESFLLPFQSEKPMIHLIYPQMVSLLRNLMVKFIKIKYIDEKLETGTLHTLNADDNKKHRSLGNIDVGTKVKTMFHDVKFLPSDAQQKFREDCLKFYTTSVSYLQLNLPFENSFIKNVQYIHPGKRTDPSSLSAVSNIALKIRKVLQNCLHSVFGMGDDEDEDAFVDTIRDQWRLYQVEEIPTTWSQEDVTHVAVSTNVQASYWRYALGVCGIEPASSPVSAGEKRVDEYWDKVSKIKGEDGSVKYVQLGALMKVVLCLSHGNAVPERGFSINKIMLDAHGYTLDNDTIAALRLVKDAILRFGGIDKFPVTRKLIKSSFSSHEKYQQYLSAKRIEKEQNEALQAEQEQQKSAQQIKKAEMEAIQNDIDACELQIKAADEIVVAANSDLLAKLNGAGKSIDKNVVASATAKINVGIGEKRRLEEKLKTLKKKKSKK